MFNIMHKLTNCTEKAIDKLTHDLAQERCIERVRNLSKRLMDLNPIVKEIRKDNTDKNNKNGCFEVLDNKKVKFILIYNGFIEFATNRTDSGEYGVFYYDTLFTIMTHANKIDIRPQLDGNAVITEEEIFKVFNSIEVLLDSYEFSTNLEEHRMNVTNFINRF